MSAPRGKSRTAKPVLQSAQRRRAARHFREAAYVHHLGMRISKLAAGEATISMPIVDSLKQYQGLAHGGALGSLADTAATMAALTALPSDSDVVTIEFKMNYLSAMREGRAVAHAKLVRLGNRIVVIEAEITSAPKGKSVATGIFTMLRVPVAER